MDNQKLNDVQSPALEQANVRRCTLINEIELVIRIADGATVLKIDEVPAMLSVGLDVFFCSVKKAGKEYEVYIAYVPGLAAVAELTAPKLNRIKQFK